MSAWWSNYAASLPNLDPNAQEFIEYITGRIPLLLRPLFKYGVGKEFDRAKFLCSEKLMIVQDDIYRFYQSISDEKLDL